MTMMTISGIQQAQRDNERMVAAMRPDEGSAIGRAVQYAMIEAHRQAVTKTHVITGSLRASHRMQQTGVHGQIYIDPASVNPDTSERPAVYGVQEHNRGGDHAFYLRAVEEGFNAIAQVAERGFRSALP